MMKNTDDPDVFAINVVKDPMPAESVASHRRRNALLEPPDVRVSRYEVERIAEAGGVSLGRLRPESLLAER
jgi:hypothetical protein